MDGVFYWGNYEERDPAPATWDTCSTDRRTPPEVTPPPRARRTGESAMTRSRVPKFDRESA